MLALVAFACNGNAQQNNFEFPLEKTDAQWRKQLKTQEYNVLIKAGTEPAFSSELNYLDKKGTFVCAACGNELYSSAHKFDSGSGWPSFDRAIKNKNVLYRADRTGGFLATEVLCANCGGHLGHVFNDGPKKTTGKRHCINGIAMNFIPKK